MASLKSRFKKSRGYRVEEPRGLAATSLRARRLATPPSPTDDAGLRERFIQALTKKEDEETTIAEEGGGG